MSARGPLAGLVCLVLAACSTAPSASVAPPTPAIDVTTLDPCALLDAANLSAAVDAEMPAGQQQPDQDGYQVCLYDAPDASTRVTVLVADTPAAAGSGERRVDELPIGGNAEELHGVGEAAWFNYCPVCTNPDATTLTVIEPPLDLTIALELPAPDGTRRIILESLGRSVIDRLGL